jgi:hypothetical protein
MSQTLNDTNGNGAMDALRSQAYGFFAAAMEYPEGELTQWIREGQISTRARELFCTIYPELAGSIEWSALAEAGVDDELSVEYTRIFDVGEANELPDHLSTQFEFLHFLIHQQLEAEAAGEVADDFIRAQRDFINRHPGSWVPLLHTQLKDSKAPAYYLAMGALMERFILLEQRYIELRVSRLPAPTPHAEPAEGQMPGEVTAARSASPEGMDRSSSSTRNLVRRVDLADPAIACRGAARRGALILAPGAMPRRTASMLALGAMP